MSSGLWRLSGRPPRSDQVVHNHRKAPEFDPSIRGSASCWNGGAGLRQSRRGAPSGGAAAVFTPPPRGRHLGGCGAPLPALAERASDLGKPRRRDDHSIPSSPTILADRIGAEPEALILRNPARVEAGTGSLSRQYQGLRLQDLTVIEYGCGVGRVTVPLAAIANEVVVMIFRTASQTGTTTRWHSGRTNIRLICARRLCLQPSSRATPFIRRSC
jgi:hypothetical protein